MLVGLALLAPAAVAGAPASSQGVRVWLLLPPSADPEAQKALQQTHDALITVLRPPVVQERVSSPDKKRHAYLYSAGAWQIGVAEPKRKAVLDALRAAWGPRLRIEDPAPESHAFPFKKEPRPTAALPDSVDFKKTADAINASLPGLLATENRDFAYDGGRGRDTGNAPVAGAETPGSGSPAPVAPSPQAAPRPASRHDALIREEAAKAGVPAEVVRAVVAAKSGFNAGYSGGGAYGLMMVSPATAESVGVRSDKLMDPQMNLRAGSRVLAKLLARYKGDLRRALAAYQAGTGAAGKDTVFSQAEVKSFLEAFDKHYAPGVPASPGAPATVELPAPAEPPPPSESPDRGAAPFDALIRQAAEEAKLSPDIVRAVAAAKSGFNPRRAGGGAYGLMMVSYGSAKAVGVRGDLLDPETNLRAGSRLLADLVRQFDGDLHRALAAYQLGVKAVRRSGGIPNDPSVRNFLAEFEKAYRHGSPVPPPIIPVEPPKNPALRAAKDAVKSWIYHDPKDPVSKWRPQIERLSAKHEVDPRLVEAIMRRENPWGDPNRVSDAKPEGAIGLMQLLPKTAKWLKVDPWDPEQNIEGGIMHLKFLLGNFKGDRVKAVAAYNAGHVPVEKLGRVPNYKETVVYVAEVFNNYYDLTGERVEPTSYMTPWARQLAKRVDESREKARTWN